MRPASVQLMGSPELVTPDIAADALGLVGESMDREHLIRLGDVELAVVYDWAIREHYRASGSNVRGRERPHVLSLSAALVDALRALDEARATIARLVAG